MNSTDIFEIEGTTLVSCDQSASGEVVIPEGVTEIGNRAFDECYELKSIVIPDSVTKIGSEAFAVCSKLESIDFPERVTEIGHRAFYYCTSLKSIVIPDSVTEIGNRAFEECSALKSIVIPDSVTKIGDDAFHDCSALESIVTPDSVTKIGDDAFLDCSALESIVIPDSVTKIGDRAFAGCSALESIVIPKCVTEIGNDAFHDCSALESIAIPDSVTKIGNYAFERCTSLNSIFIHEKVTQIGKGFMAGCMALQKLTVSGHNPKFCCIDNSLFNKEETALLEAPPNTSSYRIPEGVTTIGKYAFYGCAELKSIVIPESVTEVNSLSPYGRNAISVFDLLAQSYNRGYKTFDDCTDLKLITITSSCPSSSECDSLKSKLEDALGDRKDDVTIDVLSYADIFKSEIIKHKQEIEKLTNHYENQIQAMKKEIPNQLVRELVDEVGGWSDSERFALNSAILNAWSDKLDKETMKAVKSLRNPTPKGPSTVVQGDFVGNKNVENQVNHVASGATGITSNKSK